MSLSYKDIGSERQWRSATGLSQEKFSYLAIKFGQAYQARYGISVEEKMKNLKQEFIILGLGLKNPRL